MSDINTHDEDPQENLPEEVQSILEDPRSSIEEKKSRIVEITKTSLFKGPLPPPELLEHYNHVIKDGAERIMKMTENQATHRMGLENKAISSQLSQSKKGQIFAFIIAILLIVSSVYLAISGHEGLAKILGGTTILGLVAIFVTGKYLQKRK